MTFLKQLKKHNKTLYQINLFILQAKELKYGEIQFTVKTHNYINSIVEMKAIKPKTKTMAQSVTKRVMIKPKKKGEA